MRLGKLLAVAAGLVLMGSTGARGDVWDFGPAGGQLGTYTPIMGLPASVGTDTADFMAVGTGPGFYLADAGQFSTLMSGAFLLEDPSVGGGQTLDIKFWNSTGTMSAIMKSAVFTTIVSDPGTLTLDAFLSGAPAGSATMGVGGAYNSFGAIDLGNLGFVGLFDELKIGYMGTDPAQSLNVFGIDNLIGTPVPEPGTLALIVGAAVPVTLLIRRRRA